jgi:hypothetical protein
MIKEILKLYKEFTEQATRTREMNSNSLNDFIGWLQWKD